MSNSVKGVFPALTTPFTDGKLAVDHLKSNIEKYNDVNFSGYLVLGSTGESILLNDRERLTAIETVKSAASDGKTIIAGTGMQSNEATVDFTNRAAAAGADFALVITPFYYKSQMTAENLEYYFTEIADRSKIPVLMYNVPKFTGLNLPLETIAAVAGHPNCAGMKESSGNILFLSEILKACPEDFTILQGAGSVLFSSLIQGAHGGILALSNMAAKETVDIYELTQSGDLANAKAIQMKIITVNQKIVGAFGVPGIKCALDLLGFYGGAPRPPLNPVKQQVKDSIRNILGEAGLL